MSFIEKNFSPVGGQARAGNSPATWSFESDTDDLADIQGAGYFDEIATRIEAGDFINVTLTDGNAIITVESKTDFPRSVVINSEVIGSAVSAFPVVEETGSPKNLVLDDNFKFIVMNSGSPQTVNIPDNSAEAFDIGAEIEFLREGVGSVTFAAPGSANIQSRVGLVSINAQYAAVIIKKIDTDEWRLIGDLA